MSSSAAGASHVDQLFFESVTDLALYRFRNDSFMSVRASVERRLLYRHGLYAAGASGGEPTIDASDWRRTLGVFAVERFTEADHLRERTFDVPADFKIGEVLHGVFGIARRRSRQGN